LTVNSIDFVSHLTSSGGNAFYVKANLPQNNSYRVGMNGNADIVTDARYNVLAIQATDVFDNNYVYVKVAKGFAKRKLPWDCKMTRRQKSYRDYQRGYCCN